ncbi:MAG TPA: bifunctional phosphopantothenoylcysteine decarboxylase/phosphopantothenate--cysteine ligase CoaBC, partial [bacterium]|nr:bifunctional phosphopantothenoylcysteine decarboxylase/phosphopantothenate--cysteine ligase CoaBC [bacterium]
MSKNALYGRRILLGCGAGISLYKVCYLLRGLVRRGAEVKILLSERAKRIIHPSIFSSLAKNEVLWDQFQDQQFKPQHVRLAQWAELFLVAPATADLMTRFALGLADELITTTCLSMGGVPVILVPAMEENMWFHPATRRSADLLKERGAIFIGPDKGGLASGKKGMGRMAEPVRIIEELTQFFRERETLRGKRVLVISGPTREYLDSVRYLTNSSSGIMGRFLAEEGSLRGAEVTFITGPATVM